MERKAQNKGRGRKRKSNQDVKETTKPKNEETETSNSKVVPTFSKKRKVTKKQQEILKSDGVIPNTEDQDQSKEIEEEENTQGTVAEKSQLEDTSNPTLILEEQAKQTDITCPLTTKSEDMKQFSVSEKSSKMSEEIGSLQTTEVSDAVPLPESPLEKLKGTTNMSDLKGLDAAATTIEHPKVNKGLQTQSHESVMVTGLFEEPKEIQVGKIEIYPHKNEIPAESTELPSIDTTFITKSTKLPALDTEKATTGKEIPAPKREEEKENIPQLTEDHKKEQNVCLEQMHIKQATMIVLEENKEHSMDKEKSDTLQQHGEEHPEADKIIPKAVPEAQNDMSDSATGSLTKVHQQYLVVEQTEFQNPTPQEAEHRKLNKCLNGKELSTSIQGLKTMKCQKSEASNEFTLKSNENHGESQPPPKDSRKCFSLDDNDNSEGPKSGDTKNDLEEIVSTCIQENRQPVDNIGDLGGNEAKFHPSNKESLSDVSPPENIKTDTVFDEKPGCEDGLEGDMDITDSQLCEAVNIQESNSTLNSLEEAKKQHLEGRKIIRDLIVNLSYLNKMLLRTKREIESARRKKQPGGNRNSW